MRGPVSGALVRWLPWLALVLLAGLPAVVDSRYALSLLSQMGIAVIVCLSYWLLMGQGGMLSFGHAVYSGAGAFLAIHALRLADAGLPLPVSLLPLAAGLGAALLAWPLGWLCTRQSSTAFAMITLGLGELAWAVALMFPQLFGGEAGIAADRTGGGSPWGWSLGPAWQMYLLILVYAAATVLCIRGFTRTPAGRLLNAVRDNGERVAFMGHDPRQVRLLAFVVAAFFAGISGGLAALLHEIVTTEVLGSQRSAAVLVFTFIGGMAILAGPVIGGVLMVLGQVLLSGWTPAWLLYLGLLFLGMVLLAPGGVVGCLHHWAARAPALQVHQLGRLLAALVGLVALGAVVEMAYRLRLADTLGPQLHYLGLPLDAHALSDWLAAGLLATLALLACLRTRPAAPAGEGAP